MNKAKKHLLIIEEDNKEEIENIKLQVEKEKIINKGTGAGGKNTNFHGKKFEEKTNNQSRLTEIGYTENINFLKNHIKTETKTQTNKNKSAFYLSKTFSDKTMTFVLQNGLKTYMKHTYNIELFRCPDEAYIIEYHNPDKRVVIKILEKKEQNVEGSVETKLWSGPSLKREYEILLSNFTVHYGFCVSDFLKQKMISKEPKYTILNQILKESDIEVLFGDDDNYFESLDVWINK
jgi:hypothetical protein